jgi:hypothetical protein
VIKNCVVLSVSVLLGACASAGSGLEPAGSAVPLTSQSLPAGGPGESIEVAQVLDLENYADRVICRREAPLGSRIAHRRCYSLSDQVDAQDAWAGYVDELELRRLRDHQTFQDLAREAAFREALRQSAYPLGR